MTAPIRQDQSLKINPTAAAGKKSAPAGSTVVQNTTNRPSFAQTLAVKTTAAQAGDVKFSNHAQQRLEKRQISLTEDGLARLAQAVDKASQRGGRESMVLMDDMAFIVNVKDRVIVTALDSASRREGVFTQIDSVVFADGRQ
jgi:flagellar operon protein